MTATSTFRSVAPVVLALLCALAAFAFVLAAFSSSPAPTSCWFESTGSSPYAFQGECGLTADRPTDATDVATVEVTEDVSPVIVQALYRAGAWADQTGKFIYAPVGALIAPTGDSTWTVTDVGTVEPVSAN